MLHTKAVKISSRSDLGITANEPQGDVVMVQSAKASVTTQNIWYKASLKDTPAASLYQFITGTTVYVRNSEFQTSRAKLKKPVALTFMLNARATVAIVVIRSSPL